jgi:hypothetical protein
MAVVKTVFYKYDTYIQDKTDCNSGAVIVQLVGCGLDRVIEVRFWQGQEIFHFYRASRPNLWPIQPPVQLVGRAFSPRAKQVECEADCTHSCSAKVPLSARPCG